MKRPTPLHACLLLTALFPAAVAAADTATIQIQGHVLAGTCSVAADAQIKIPDVQGGKHPPGRIGASATAFTMLLSGCAGVAQAALTFGKPADADSKATDSFRNQAANNRVNNIALSLQKEACAGKGSTVKPGDKIIYPVTGAQLSIPLCATYWKTDGEDSPLSPGAVETAIVVNIAYQ